MGAVGGGDTAGGGGGGGSAGEGDGVGTTAAMHDQGDHTRGKDLAHQYEKPTS